VVLLVEHALLRELLEEVCFSDLVPGSDLEDLWVVVAELPRESRAKNLHFTLVDQRE